MIQFTLKSNFSFITHSIIRLGIASLSLDESLEIVENTKIKLGQNKGTTAEKVNRKLLKILENN